MGSVVSAFKDFFCWLWGKDSGSTDLDRPSSSAQAYADAARSRMNKSSRSEVDMMRTAAQNFVLNTARSTDPCIQQARQAFLADAGA